MAGYIGKIAMDGYTRPVASALYGECATASDTATKVVTCDDFDTLVTGVTIFVKFTYTNTADDATLNVNGSGARTILGSTGSNNNIIADHVTSFTYDGTYWVINNLQNNGVIVSSTQPDASTCRIWIDTSS